MSYYQLIPVQADVIRLEELLEKYELTDKEYERATKILAQWRRKLDKINEKILCRQA